MSLVETIQPWYKQFWPWFIILLPASVVVAGITTVFIAFNNQDSLVADDYYKQGMGINQLLAEDDMARQLAVNATINLEPLIGEVRVSLKGQFELQPSQLLLEWIHPTNQGKDFSMALIKTPNGDYLGQLSVSMVGRWYLQLSSIQPAPWRLKAEALLSSGQDDDATILYLAAKKGG